MLNYYESCYRDVEDLLSNDNGLRTIIEDAPNIACAVLLIYSKLRSDELSDYVTGEASGSYNGNAYASMRMVLDNTVDVAKAYIDLGIAYKMAEDFNNEQWEKIDVNARIGNLWNATFDAVLDYLDNKDK